MSDVATYPNDAESVSSSISIRPDLWKLLKIKIKGITAHQKMREFVMEHHDQLNAIPTALLNTICRVDGYKFCKHRGAIGLVRKQDTRYSSAVAMRKEIDGLKAIIEYNVELGNIAMPQ